jgi:hypothetical protein
MRMLLPKTFAKPQQVAVGDVRRIECNTNPWVRFNATNSQARRLRGGDYSRRFLSTLATSTLSFRNPSFAPPPATFPRKPGFT